jgi:hypothetical protein
LLAHEHLRALIAAAVALLMMVLVNQAPAIAASVTELLRWVSLQVQQPAAILRAPVLSTTLAQAQASVPWRIVVLDPGGGFSLAAVFLGDIHEHADGSTVMLRYLNDQGQELAVTQLRPRSPLVEPVAEGATSPVQLGSGEEGMAIVGKWRDEPGLPVWEDGTMLRLIFERDQLVVQLQADPREGWTLERLAEVAGRLR